MDKQAIVEELERQIKKINHDIYHLQAERSEDGDRVAHYLREVRHRLSMLKDMIKAEGAK